MASSALESTAALRAKAIGVEQWIIQKFQERHMDTYGRFAFAITYSPQHPNGKPVVDFVESVVEREVGADQMMSGAELKPPLIQQFLPGNSQLQNVLQGRKLRRTNWEVRYSILTLYHPTTLWIFL